MVSDRYSERIPAVFGKPGIQFWYVLGSSFFFLLFSVFYKPFDMVASLSMGKNIFFFNATLMMCVIMGSLAITRIVIFFAYKWAGQSWWHYLFCCLMEFVVASLFVALYLCLMRPGEQLFFDELTGCVKYVFGILVYPYFAVTLVAAYGSRNGEVDNTPESAAIIRFLDPNKQLRIAVARDALLYIKAEENYVRIYYVDQDSLKDYQLRGSMNSIGELMTRNGIFRCHRSFYVNPGHIKALRKDKYNQISAELDTSGVVIPVSRTAYPSLTTLI